MGVISFLASFYLLAIASLFARPHQEAKQKLNNSTLHMTLYRVLGHDSQSPPSISELLTHDQARVKYLNSRLTKSEQLFGPELTSTSIDLDVSPAANNYYVNIGLGTPPSSYRVMIDTGSSLSWLQCPSNEAVSPFFDPSASSTFQSIPCPTPKCSALLDATNNPVRCMSNQCLYTATYGDDSLSSGLLIQDTLTLSQSEFLLDFVCGCAQNMEQFSSQFSSQFSGLFGLARHKLSMFSQLSVIYGNAFSYCLPSPSVSSGGSLSIGSGSLLGAPYKFTPMLTHSQYNNLYLLNLVAIAVSGTTLQVPAKYNLVVIDSGTEITRLPFSLYRDMALEVVKNMAFKAKNTKGTDIFDICYEGSVKEMSDLPEIRLVFQGGADLTLAPRSVFIDLVEKGITCLAFAPDDIGIIGNVQQQTYRVAYDVSNSMIGFAAGGCS